MNDRIKVDGKTGNLGGTVSLTRDAKLHDIKVSSKVPTSKRYMKYLTKKFLKKQQLRDYIRVVADDKDKSAYVLKYFNVSNEEEEQ